MASCLAGLTAQDAADLRLADVEVEGKLPLRLTRPDASDFSHLCVGQACTCSMLSDLTVLHAGPRAISATPMNERRPAGGTSTLGGWICQRTAHVSARDVMCDVHRPGGDLQIFQPIVYLDFVAVMDDLVGTQRSAQRLAHHQPMFKDVTGWSGVRMIGSSN